MNDRLSYLNGTLRFGGGLMKRTKVHELADEFGTTPGAILRLLRGRGFSVRGTSSRVDAYAVEWLRFEFTVDQPPPPPRVAVTVPQPSVRRREWAETWRPRRLRSQEMWPEYTTPRAPRRSLRSVALIGSGAADIAGLDVDHVEKGLQGSPYSLPAEQAEYLTSNFLPRVAALSIRAQRELDRISSTRRAMLRRITRSSEIFESNQIEGLGPDLATTDRVLHSNDLHRRADISVAQQAIERCFDAEPTVRDVVGLGAARILAEVFCYEPDRPLTQSDVRELHQLILMGDPLSGSYKIFTNEIAGAVHLPATPSDTPGAMSDLVCWLAQTQLAPLWRAAVVHAWLTHIHPFHDGNGRVARLLANLVLIREGLPPLIVKASGDRGAYLDALAASDEGGDILPLARVFRDVLSRAVQDLADPTLVAELFEDEVAQRSAPAEVQWNALLGEFLSELAPRLLLHRLNLYVIGEISDAELRRIGSGRPENAWIAKVSAHLGARDLLLHVAAPSWQNRQFAGTPITTPSIFVSVRNGRPLDARQYLPVGQETFTYEFTPLLDNGTMMMRRGSVRREHPVDEAADAAAEHLARAHRQLIGDHR
jgi:Fic family protein